MNKEGRLYDLLEAFVIQLGANKDNSPEDIAEWIGDLMNDLDNEALLDSDLNVPLYVEG